MVSDVKPSEPKLCANGCGFFGSPSTLGLCSKCHREEQPLIKDEAFVPSLAAVSPSQEPEAVVPLRDRCRACKKRVRVAGGGGFKCRCGYVFCTAHRYPEMHKCSFDYKAMAKSKIAKANPRVKADKIQRI